MEHNGSMDRLGLVLFRSGQLRVYTLSSEGREVVTRMLRYFQGEGMVKLTRGTMEIVDEDALARLQE